uniref:Uncharacterized protein n=1 Tax=Physcomitrium patens TaxID=3218 RepID=A0A2K1K017_PHYPA|nr:hypothetical protein PHYPA_014242 [Physcomitrium patens]
MVVTVSSHWPRQPCQRPTRFCFHACACHHICRKPDLAGSAVAVTICSARKRETEHLCGFLCSVRHPRCCYLAL